MAILKSMLERIATRAESEGQILLCIIRTNQEHPEGQRNVGMHARQDQERHHTISAGEREKKN